MPVGSSISRGLLRTQPDQRLVELCRRGQGEAFEEIVRRYRDPLVAFATTIVPFAVAEEVVQASLTSAHRSLAADGREIRLRAWLFTIVRNRALNAYAAERPHSPLADDLAGGRGPAELAEESERLERVVGGILALPDNQRRAIVRRELDGAGYGEIAADLMTTPTAVRGLIFRARTALRESLGLLIPLPLLQTGLAGGSSTLPGALAGATAGGAPKMAAATAAAVVAIGSGVAIQGGGLGSGARGGGDGDGGDSVSMAAVPKAKEEDGAALVEIEADDDEDDTGAGEGSRAGTRQTRTGDRSASAGDSRGERDATGAARAGGTGHGSGSGGSSGPGSEWPADHGGSSGSGSSGPGSPAPTEATGPSGSGGPSSGSGSSGSGSSGSGEGSSGSEDADTVD